MPTVFVEKIFFLVIAAKICIPKDTAQNFRFINRSVIVIMFAYKMSIM